MTVVRTPAGLILEIREPVGLPVYGSDRWHLRALTERRRIGAAGSALGHVEIAVRSELESARIVEPRDENGHSCGPVGGLLGDARRQQDRASWSSRLAGRVAAKDGNRTDGGHSGAANDRGRQSGARECERGHLSLHEWVSVAFRRLR